LRACVLPHALDSNLTKTSYIGTFWCEFLINQGFAFYWAMV